jgi:hypothetical protein
MYVRLCAVARESVLPRARWQPAKAIQARAARPGPIQRLDGRLEMGIAVQAVKQVKVFVSPSGELAIAIGDGEEDADLIFFPISQVKAIAAEMVRVAKQEIDGIKASAKQ